MNHASSILLILLMISESAMAVDVFYCSRVFQLSNKKTIQRSVESYEIFKLLRHAENNDHNQYFSEAPQVYLIENKYSVDQLNLKVSELAADYPQERIDELMPLFIQLKKTIQKIKQQNYPEKELIEAFSIYTYLVDAKLRLQISLPELEQKIRDNIKFFLFQTNADLATPTLYRGKYIFTFAKPDEIDLLDFIRARALGYHIIGVTSLDRLIFDGFSKQGSSFFSKHDGYHAKFALKNDQKYIQLKSTTSLTDQLTNNQKYLLKLVNKIEETADERLQLLQKIIVFHFDHELGLSLKYEIDHLLKADNVNSLHRELMNMISDIEFDNYGAEAKNLIGRTNKYELIKIMKELFKDVHLQN